MWPIRKCSFCFNMSLLFLTNWSAFCVDEAYFLRSFQWFRIWIWQELFTSDQHKSTSILALKMRCHFQDQPFKDVCVIKCLLSVVVAKLSQRFHNVSSVLAVAYSRAYMAYYVSTSVIHWLIMRWWFQTFLLLRKIWGRFISRVFLNFDFNNFISGLLFDLL